MRSVAWCAAPFFLAAQLSAAIAGSVILPDGSAVAGARVQAFRPFVLQLGIARSEPLATATTDKTGAFSLNVSGRGVIDVHVEVDGYAPADQFVATDEDAGTIPLRSASTVEGKVTANGKPVAGATVAVIPSVGMPVFTKTNSSGVYRIADPTLWADSIAVQHPDFARLTHPANARDFALDAGKEVRGVVVDAEERPVAEAKVTVDQTQFATTDAAGRFTLSHVPNDATVITARKRADMAQARIAGTMNRLKLGPAVRVTGTVRDADKRPLAGMVVALMAQLSSNLTVTDDRGAFLFEVLPEKYALMLEELAGYSAEGEGIDVTAGDVTHDLIAQRQPSVRVTVQTEDHKPVAGASLSFLYVGAMGMQANAPARVVTAADGSARVRMPPLDRGMTLRLLAVKSGMPPAISPPITSSSVTLTMPNGTPIAGVVQDGDDHPVSGVLIAPIIGNQYGSEIVISNQPWATTDEEGRFRARLTDATIALAFAKSGYAPLQEPVEVRADLKPLKVVLTPGGAISGRVVNHDGTPAAEVRIQAGDKFGISAADGSFSIEGVQSGPQLVQFGRRLVQQQMVSAPAHDVVLRLPAMRTIRGRVLDAATGGAVEKFAVMTRGTQGLELGVTDDIDSPVGEFAVEAAVGPTRLTVAAANYVTVKDVVVPAASDDPVVIRLSHGRRVRGRVVDERQQPVAGVSVHDQDVDAPGLMERGAPLETAADGSFELSGISFEHAVRLFFFKQDGEYVAAERRVPPGPDDVTLEVVLRHGIRVSGRVLGRSAALQDVTINATSASQGAGSQSATADESGAFEFKTLTPGRYDFIAQSANGAERGVVKDVDVEKTHDITIRMEGRPTSIIYGRITGLSPGATGRFVTATNTEDESQSGSIDVGGSYRIENAPSGTVDVQAQTYDSQGSRVSKKVTVDAPPGAEVRADLTFATPVAVHGRVTRGGQPVVAVNVTFSGSATGIGLTGMDGTYQTRLEPGEYNVEIVSVNEALPFSQHVVITDPAQLDFNIDPNVIVATVVDAGSGAPISGATVTAAQRGLTHATASAATGADGTASLEVARGETMTITAAKSGYANAAQDVNAGDSQPVVLRLARSPGAVVRIVDMRDGRTLSGYLIARDAAGRVVASSSESDAEGTVTLPVAAGRYTFSASAEGYGSQSVKGDVPSSEIRVPLPRGGSVSIRSRSDARGTARLIQPDGEEYVRCWCSGVAEIKIDGRATLVDRVAPGSYTLEVTLAGEKPKRMPVTVVEGQTAVVTVE